MSKLLAIQSELPKTPDVSGYEVLEHPQNVTFMRLIIWFSSLCSLAKLRNIFLKQPAPVWSSSGCVNLVVKSLVDNRWFLDTRDYKHMWVCEGRGDKEQMLLCDMEFKIAPASAKTVRKTESVSFRLPGTISRLFSAVKIGWEVKTYF